MPNDETYFLNRDWRIAVPEEGGSPKNTPEPVSIGDTFRFHRQGRMIVCKVSPNESRYVDWESAAFVYDASHDRLLGISVFHKEGPTVIAVTRFDNGDGKVWIECSYSHYRHSETEQPKFYHYGYWHGDGGDP
ncbi:MAG TPA: hypothetical protein VF267_05335 [Gammaproteobacteria bacterium]